MRMKILIYGWYGFRNIGDELILDSIIYRLRETYRDPMIGVLCCDKYETEKEHNVRAYNYFSWRNIGILKTMIIHPKNMFDFLRYFFSTDMIILGGGGFLTDWGNDNLIQWLRILKISKLMRKKIIVYGCGVHSISTNHGRKLIKKYLKYADYVTLRDRKSKDILTGVLKDSSKLVVTADPAIQAAKIFKLKQSENKKIRIGLSFNYWFNKPSLPNYNINKFELLKKYINKIIAYLIEKFDADIILIPMQQRSKCYNNEFSDMNFYKEITDDNKFKIEVVNDNLSVKEVCQIFSQLTIYSGMQLHSSIISASYNIPSLGLAYDPKVIRFYEQIQMPCYNIDDIIANPLLINEVLSKYKEIIQSLDAYKKILNNNVIALQKSELLNLDIIDFVDK